MKQVIPSTQVQLGMFVTELDRPWLGTPFLLQGFLVDDDQQIADLTRCCTTVTIDRSRSIGPHFAVEGREQPTLRRSSSSPPTPTVTIRSVPDEFPSVYRSLRETPVLTSGPRRPQSVPPVFGIDNQSRLEAELVYSAPIVDDVKKTLQSVRSSVGTGISGEIKEVAGMVAEMAESVERNPDAMIWLTRLRTSDEYSYDHAVDVSVHLMVLARYLGMSGKTVELLGLVGLMQDVGKVHIPETVLSKNDPLTAEELTQVQSHVASSMQILVGQAEFSFEALNIVGSHHERFDGSGYPRRIQGEKISLHAELAGLIDTYCAMTRQRSYCGAVSSQKALESLIGMRDTKFRAPLVDQLIQCVGLYPIGSLVELNSGEVGVVIQQNQVRRLKPRVMIVLGPDKSVERKPRTIDLIMDPPCGTGEPYRIIHSLPMDAYGIDPTEFYLG
jgi:HD-GYP domain-containing protein (c-di-GMP phosphodiesterase class II)